MTVKEQLTPYFPTAIRAALERVSDADFALATEIRLRVNRPALLVTRTSAGAREITLLDSVSPADLAAALDIMCSRSVYAFADKLSAGFLTLPGGHRVGVAGALDGNLRDIGSMNVRVARSVTGAADRLMPEIANPLKNVLIISPPGCGKTTLLRDIARQISDVFKKNVGIADERGEIAGCVGGVPQLDVGRRADVIDAVQKSKAVMMLIRSMSPEVIAADEIGSREDAEAVEAASRCGIKIICTAHGNGLEDAAKLSCAKVFEKIAVLRGVGKIEGIYDN